MRMMGPARVTPNTSAGTIMILRFVSGIGGERHVRPDRRPLEVDGRQHDDEDGEPEVRDGEGEDGQDASDVVGRGILADGRHDADRTPIATDTGSSSAASSA